MTREEAIAAYRERIDERLSDADWDSVAIQNVLLLAILDELRARRMTREANFMYVHSNRMGYGILGTSLFDALTEKGIVLRGHPDQDGPTSVASWVAIPSHAKGWYADQWTSIVTMWETTRLPEAFREQMDELDQIIVPSDQNVELFSQHHRNVVKMRFGFDPIVWHYQARQPANNEFVFLCGGSGERKGVDLVARAYKKLWRKPGSWGSGPTPVVWFKSPTGRVTGRDGDVPLILDRMKIVGGRGFSETDIADLYSLAHCYVQPSKGEGFGLQPLQAIAQGCPTILTDAHGQAEYAHLGWGIGAKQEKAAYFMLGEAGDWWEPDFDELCDTMQHIYKNYDDVLPIADDHSQAAHAHFTWAHAAEDWIDIHGDKLSVPYGGDWTWYSPEKRQYMVKTLRRWTPEIGGTNYLFDPYVEYWVPADVKRLAYEHEDLLHPDALANEEGLTEAQIATLGTRRAHEAYCPTCGQQINSGMTRADVYYKELTQ